MRRRHGFTIIELLVVIGIIGLLMAILLPVLWRVRGAAMKVVCAARLRDLTMAATMYQGDHRVFPEPMEQIVPAASGPATVRPAPQRISGDLLNELRPYLKFPEIEPTTSIESLPPFVQCPFIEGQTEDRGPFLAPAPLSSSYYTGYSYFGRIAEVAVPEPPPSGPSGPPPLLSSLLNPLARLPIIGGVVSVLEPGVELKPGRAAGAKSTKRAVLWADNVAELDDTGKTWQYTHTRRATRGSGTITYADPSELLGQHRAFTDGSVEWVAADSDELPVGPSRTPNGSTASFKTILGALWWF